ATSSGDRSVCCWTLFAIGSPRPWRRFVGRDRVDHPGVVARLFPNDRQMLARAGPAKGDRPTARRAGVRLVVFVLEDLFHLLLGDAVFRDVSDVAIRIIVQIPDDDRLHYPAPSLCTPSS